jgi:hypothetical protein
LERHLGRARFAAGEAWIEAEKAGRLATFAFVVTSCDKDEAAN